MDQLQRLACGVCISLKFRMATFLNGAVWVVKTYFIHLLTPVPKMTTAKFSTFILVGGWIFILHAQAFRKSTHSMQQGSYKTTTSTEFKKKKRKRRQNKQRLK